MGGRPGSTTAVEIRGEHLDRAHRVVFTTPDVSGRVTAATFTRLSLEITVKAAAEPGPRYFRVITPRGASNLLLFRISEWPTVTETEPNNDREGLPLLAWPALVSGQLANPKDVDLFRFQARAGEQLTLTVLAARNWSGADLSLAVLDPKGRALAQDEGRLIWDPYVQFTAPHAGNYIAAVMLTRMPAGGQSRTDLVYQLAIGQAPFLRAAFPSAVRLGKPATVEVIGDSLGGNGNGGRSLTMQIRDVSESGAELNPPHPSGIVAPLTLIPTDLPTASEAIHNDTPAAAQKISLPVTINARIETDFDEDVYRFEARQGEALVFIVDAEKWGSRLDARLTLLDDKGKPLASNDDARVLARAMNWDPKLEYSIERSGVYYVKVHSPQRRGGEEYFYSLTARPQRPTFAVSLGTERVAVRRGDKANWTVNVQREEGFGDDVIVELRGLPAGVRAEPARIKCDQTSGSINVVAAGDAPLDAVPVEVVARPAHGKTPVVKAIVPASRITGRGPGFVNYRSTEAWLSVVEPPLLSLESAVSEVFLVRGGVAEFGVKVVRRGDGELEFSAENLPAGVNIDHVEIIDEGRMARVMLRASENAATGRVPDVAVVAKAAGRTEASPRLNVQVD